MSEKKVGIILGSIRTGSSSKIIATAMKELFPANYVVEEVSIGHLPLYNPDLDTPQGAPDAYTDFREKIKEYDGILFITPEHNRSLPAALKNALDIGSRPFGKSVWNQKTALIVSQATGAIGGFGANHHLRQVLTFLNIQPVQQPELYLGMVNKYIENGKIANQDTLALLQKGVDAFIALMERN
ncbi:MAG: NAD(P)H-dependent oxidoreductase [Clostridiales bacterium]|nr:NAD(P)H-dependent oxidoreductase [Clostridiales bacterium]